MALRRKTTTATAVLLGLSLAACGGTAPPPQPAKGTTLGDELNEGEPGDGTGGAAQPAVDPEELRIAAIEVAMNQLAPAAHLCWAVGAADDFHLAGDVRALVSLDDKARAKASISADSTKDAALTDCLVRVLEGYPWPSALAGEGVELPFSFRAPRAQNAIDRRFVPRKAQQGAEIGVLLDEKNSGSPAAAMLEVALAPGASLPMARVDRDELWYALEPLRVTGPDRKPIDLAAGDALSLSSGSYRAVTNAGASPARWVIFAVPGGAEGTARAGALPVSAGTPTPNARGPQVVRRAQATRYPRTGGATTIYFEAAPPPPARRGHADARQRRVASLSLLEIDAGARVAPHRHADETELLYLLSGAGTMIVDGIELPVGATSVVQIPKGVEHSFSATEATTAVQLYTPPGPEQRFKTMK